MSIILDDAVAAVVLGVSRQKVRFLAREGIIPHFRLGRELRFERSVLLDWARQESLRSVRQSSGEHAHKRAEDEPGAEVSR